MPNESFTLSNGARLLMARDISCDKMKQIHLNVGDRLESSCIPPVNRVPHCGQIESLWKLNYGRRGLQLSTEPPSVRKGESAYLFVVIKGLSCRNLDYPPPPPYFYIPSSPNEVGGGGWILESWRPCVRLSVCPGFFPDDISWTT